MNKLQVKMYIAPQKYFKDVYDKCDIEMQSLEKLEPWWLYSEII